ncbi:MAG: NAD(P)H-dependent oxidoreductase subunit E, partial [Candidatus Rifleibacteriota bacterium]
IKLLSGEGDEKITIKVCVGTNCFVKGSQEILRYLTDYIKTKNLEDHFEVRATFCFENCGGAPNVMIGDQLISECSFEKLKKVLDQNVESLQLGK